MPFPPDPPWALSLWAGQSVALAKRSQPAADIVAEFVSGGARYWPGRP